MPTPGLDSWLANSSDYWREIVIPDYEQFRKEFWSLRRAYHSAVSLFHMAAWVYVSHRINCENNCLFLDKDGKQTQKYSEQNFANGLEAGWDDFARIRGIANAAKHLNLRPASIRPVTYAVKNAANTYVEPFDMFCGRPICDGPSGGGGEIMLEGSPPLPFSKVAKGVFEGWQARIRRHSW